MMFLSSMLLFHAEVMPLRNIPTHLLYIYGAGLTLAFKKFSLSLEASGRSSKVNEKRIHAVSGEIYMLLKSRKDIQYMAALSYNVKDNVVLCYNLGRQFDPALKDKGELISGLSLNFGFGGPTAENITMEL